MFSRSTAPAHCASGRDSMGRHCRCCPISASAWAGVNTAAQLDSVLFLVAAGAGVRVVLLLVDAHLLVEALGDTLELVHGRVVLLHFDLVHLRLLFRSDLVARIADRGLVL